MLHELLSLPEHVGKVEPALFEALKIDLHPEPELAQQMLIHGYFDCLPIGRVGTDDLLALRAFPGRTLAQCPVVLLHPKTAGSRIISDQLGGAIPSLLIDLLYDCPDVLWDMFAIAPDDVRQEVLDVHLALGGQEANLAAFWTVLEDPQAAKSWSNPTVPAALNKSIKS